MPKAFKYNVTQLIQGVRDRPCLWDKTIENYKDRIERRTAWEEIFCMLDEGYESMTWEEKRITGEVILHKWTNIRDTFVKTLKTRMGKPKKKYLLYEDLKFLTKVIPEEERSLEYSTEEAVSFMKQENEGESSSRSTRKKSKKTDYNEDYSPPKKKKSDRSEVVKLQESDDDDNVEYLEDNGEFVEVESDPRVMNEDEAFFASLLPTVVKYNEDERLEFRIEVLAVMKKIRDKTQWVGTVDD